VSGARAGEHGPSVNLQTEDVGLLSQWRQRRDRSAIDQLVRRHVNFVYGCARRQVGDKHLAEDVTQAVFMLLLQKSPRLRCDAALSVWLHRTTRYASANARRMQLRRARREQLATELAMQQSEPSPANREFDDVLPMLDDAISRLPAADREGVLLSYFGELTFRQVGESMGISEEAARKRVSRAVERMREYFVSRGVVASAAGIAKCLAAQSAVVAPEMLVNTTVNVAALSTAASASGATAAIVKGVVHSMMMTKLKLAAAASLAIAVGGVVTTAAIQHSANIPGVAALATSSMLLAEKSFTAAPADNLQVEFLGVAPWGSRGEGWFAIDGSKVDDPRGPFRDENLRVPAQTSHQLVIRVQGTPTPSYDVQIPAAKSVRLYDLTPTPDEAFLLVPFTTAKEQKSIDVELLLADGEWQPILTAEHRADQPLGSHPTPIGGISLTHISPSPNGGSIVYIAYETTKNQVEVFCTDDQGNEQRTANIRGGPVGEKFATWQLEFALPPEQITGLVVKSRPFNRRVIARNVALDPASPTKPQITCEQIPPKP
jgi:RNA polymerase sigma factor (sigma-70 family)